MTSRAGRAARPARAAARSAAAAKAAAARFRLGALRDRGRRRSARAPEVVHAAVGGVDERGGAALPACRSPWCTCPNDAELRRARVDRGEQRGRADRLPADPVAVAERRRVDAEHVDRGRDEAQLSASSSSREHERPVLEARRPRGAEVGHAADLDRLVLQVVPVEVAQGARDRSPHEVVIAGDADHGLGGHLVEPAARTSSPASAAVSRRRSSSVGQTSPATSRTSQGGTAGQVAVKIGDADETHRATLAGGGQAQFTRCPISPSSWKSVSCSPAGASSRALSEFHGVRVGSAITVAPASASVPRRRARVVDLERDADVAGDAPPDLDLVDEGGVRRIGQLQRGAAAVEDGRRARRASSTPPARSCRGRRGRSAAPRRSRPP